MRLRIPARITLALVAVPGLFVICGYCSIVRSFRTLEQPVMALRPNVIATRTIPMAVRTLNRGDLVQADDISMHPWPVSRIGGDVALSDRQVSGCIVVKEITPGVPISIDSVKLRSHRNRSVGRNP